MLLFTFLGKWNRDLENYFFDQSVNSIQFHWQKHHVTVVCFTHFMIEGWTMLQNITAQIFHFYTLKKLSSTKVVPKGQIMGIKTGKYYLVLILKDGSRCLALPVDFIFCPSTQRSVSKSSVPNMIGKGNCFYEKRQWKAASGCRAVLGSLKISRWPQPSRYSSLTC